MQLEIRLLNEDATLPAQAHADDAGLDLAASETVTVPSKGNALVPTGIAIALPSGTAGFVHPRSGLAAKYMVTVLNTPGTIDAGYRGEILVNLINHGRKPYTVRAGERIAQLVVQRVETPVIQCVETLQPTERGLAGHGSTGF